MSSAQIVRMQAEMRLWRAMLKESEGDLQKAFGQRDCKAIRRLEREVHGIRRQLCALHAMLDSVPFAV